MSDKRLLKAIQGQPLDRAPIWMMRQAGRYLPSYQAVRAQAGDFISLCQNPTLAAEVTCQPVERYGLDAAIIFSDILILPHAMGAPLRFAVGEGPLFDQPLQTAASIDAFGQSLASYDYLGEAIEKTVARLSDDVAMLGFCGSPWTVATYLVEGKGSKQFATIKGMAYQNPALLSQLLDKLTEASIDYLGHQIQAGAEAVMIFDSWGHVLTPEDYETFSLAYMAKITSAIQDKYQVPVMLFTKGACLTLPKLAQTGCDVIGVDWTVPLDVARQYVGDNVCLQGNLDPSILMGSDALIASRVSRVLQQADSSHGRYIFNLGHGMTPNIDPDKVDCLVKAVKTQSQQRYSS